MATLSRELRRALETAVLAARAEAEAGARKTLEQLAVAHRDPWTTMTPDQQALRRRLRARGRQLGDRLENGGQQGVAHLTSECAYEHWHRMLFARFLAECELLIEPESGVSVSVKECKELARERGADWISLASAFAQRMLPQIFRADDAVLEMTLPAEHRQPLEQLLASLPTEVFLADDSLGWVYQFWQSEEKRRVNDSEVKIGADQLPAVTQLFTEDYMVAFLLHNTLGAWWAGRLFPNGVEGTSEVEARAAVALPGIDWKYLRLLQRQPGYWVPVAGTFVGWPDSAQEIRVLDPCMGSGHFLVFALPILAAMRAAEESLSARQAQLAVLRDNLFGLEIDPRCTQIGAFNLALSIWKLTGWQPLPALNVACSGLAMNAKREDWLRLAGSDERAIRGMDQLYELFARAPVLGSLVNPRRIDSDLLATGFHDLQPIVEKALRTDQTEVTHELAVTAQGVAKAAEILSSYFTLVATNVPYLGAAKQVAGLRDYCQSNHRRAKHDLATCFVERSLELCSPGGSAALVTPQNWLFLQTYGALRSELLTTKTFDLIGRLGVKAFQTPMWDFNVMLVCLTNDRPPNNHMFAGVDVASAKSSDEKSYGLQTSALLSASQLEQLKNPTHSISFATNGSQALLSAYVDVHYGSKPGQTARVTLCFWEVETSDSATWRFLESTPVNRSGFTGKSWVCLTEAAIARQGITEFGTRGAAAWGGVGVVLSQMASLPCSLYLGQIFDNNTSVLVPRRQELLAPVWAFVSSHEFPRAVRERNQKLDVDTGSMVAVPFDLARWTTVGTQEYPEGLPKPSSPDPTQWIFVGHPRRSDNPLLVAVARLLGYRWPRQTGASFPECPSLGDDSLVPFQDADGIVCISAVKGEEPAAERLGALLAAAYGDEWAASRLSDLLEQVGYGGKTLEMWLRNAFFEQHCEVFHQRPFVWHVWDGLKDGFSALVNYHRLTKASLEKLTYAYLGDWIRRQEAAVRASEPGSEARLVAAMRLQDELKKILEGEPPCDIFVRWKPLMDQPVGWEPDLNDGVRVNIRPFLLARDVGKKGAGILRIKPNIGWEKDRGKEQPRSKHECPWLWGWDGNTENFAGGLTFDGNRWNDLHYSREFKIAARRGNGLV